MTEVYTLVYYILSLLIFVHNVTPKFYVLDLTNEGSDREKKNIQELLQIIKNSEPYRVKEINSYENDNTEELVTDEDPDYEADEVDCLTSAEKLKCLEINKEKFSVGREHRPFGQRPKRTALSLYNYYGGIFKYDQPLPDISRQQFSQDYVDVGDLSRYESICRYPDCDRLSSHYFERKLRGRVSKLPRFKKNINRRVSQRDLSVESTSSDSSDSDSRMDRREKRHRKPNRFQVVFNEDSSIESEEVKPKKKAKKTILSEYDDFNEKRKKLDSKPVKLREKYSYLQGNKLYDSFRRRLEHFLLKRFHWNSDDIHHLGYYWFDGPRGKDNAAR